MKILCVSDEVDPLVYSNHLKDRYGDVDLVLSAGDLPTDYLGFIVSILNKPLVFVSGNHDPDPRSARAAVQSPHSENLFHSSHGATDTGFRITRVAGLSILGLPGALRYNRGPHQFSEFAMTCRLAAMAPRLLLNLLLRGRAVDIVLTHAPPRGIHDRDDPCHRGFVVFRRVIRHLKPEWFVHGHVHLYDLSETRVTAIDATTVVNAFGHWVIETGRSAG